MKLMDLLLVTSTDNIGVIYYKQDIIYDGSLRDVFIYPKKMVVGF